MIEILEREIVSKTLCKYFDYFDKTLLVLSATSGSVSMMASFATVIGAPVGIISESLSLVFFVGNRTAKNILKTMTKNKKRYSFICMQ